jgi:predicted  nucleic acid-binding Zn-ribbon protein
MRASCVLLPFVAALAACDMKAKKDLRRLARADSIRVDSLVSMKNELLNEVMASTQFVADLNTELAKLKSRTPNSKLNTAAAKESEVVSIKEQRAAIQARIAELVARLDSSESRVVTLRARAAQFAKRDSTITRQVAAYERTIADLRRQVDEQKAEYEATIARQNVQIATLNSRVDTVSRENLRLSGEKVVLTDSVSQLTTERNTAYYVIGTKDELVSQGIVVEEGHKRFMFLGGRSLTAARELDPSKFTKIDRLKDRVISLPAGDYRIISRQNAAYASPFSQHGSTVSGGLRIDQPEHFWEASPFLILVKG